MSQNANPLPDLVAEHASAWDARLRAPDCTDAERAEFARWRDADAAHRGAFEDLQNIVTRLRAEMGRADVRALRDSALALVKRRRQRRAIGIAAAAMVVSLAGLLWLMIPDGLDLVYGTRHYETGIGQRSSVTLKDGSSVELNARTRIAVAFDKERRTVQLLQGQALFHVALDSRRPFVVHAGDREIVALGTAFDVRLDKRSVRVTLIDGKVSVEHTSSTTPATQETFLRPGQQLFVSYSGTQVPVVRAIDTAKVTGWREGRVFLEDMTLQEAVDEMNRHSPVQIVIDGPALESLRVNGMFKAGEQDTFVSALEDYFPIAARRRGEMEIVLSPRG